MKILSQRDPKWKDQILGFGNKNTTTIEYFGCTITSLAMLAGITPDDVNNRLNKVRGYAESSSGVSNLIIWSKIQEAIPWMEFEWRGYGYENDKVKAAIDQSGGCLVEVNGSRIGASRHWVLYVGNQEMHDPWFGTKKGTSYYAPTGYATIKRIGNPTEPNMEKTYTESEMTAMRLERDKNWNLYQSALADVTEAKSLAESRKTAYLELSRLVSGKLGLPGTADEADIAAGLDRLLEVEDQLNQANKKLENEEKKHYIETSELKGEIAQLRLELEKAQLANDKLLARVDDLEARIEANQEQIQHVSSIRAFIESVLKYFKKG